MDTARFDALVRSLTTAASRRGLVAGFTGGLVARSSGVMVGVAAKKNQKKRRFRPACGERVCGDDGCGGSCGSCAGGMCGVAQRVRRFQDSPEPCGNLRTWRVGE